MYYFAYGSNISEERLKKREVKYTSRSHAILKGYNVVFNKKAQAGEFAYANIEEDQNSEVEGALYLMNEQDLTVLDSFEGAPRHYQRLNIDVISAGKNISAITYIAVHDKIKDGLKPKREYLDFILTGKDIFSPEYFDKLSNTETLD